MRVLVTHAYSALNKGDGLLVDETIALIREALGKTCEIHVVASDPDSFRELAVTELHNSKPLTLEALKDYLKHLWRIGSFDLIVAVGGGYLRAGTCKEALKTSIIHGPQLMAAAASGRPVIYMPQSIGPLRGPFRPIARLLLARMQKVFLRDDRSVREVGLANLQRTSDLALMADASNIYLMQPLHPRPILSVRYIRGRIPPAIRSLAQELGDFDGYVQSSTGGNDDTPAMASLKPKATLTTHEFLGSESNRRVVVAVRLHAALMALNAGHLVIHLAYERKGFGVFADLGLHEYVHRVSSFDVNLVLGQMERLSHDLQIREHYDRSVAAARERALVAHRSIVRELTLAATGSSRIA